MKLGIVSLKKFYRTDGEYLTTGGFGKYVESLAPYFSEIELCVPVAKGTVEGGYPIDANNITFTHLPVYRNELQFIAKSPLTFLKIALHVQRCDIVNARIPDFTGIFGFLLAKALRKPLFLSVIADWEEQHLVRQTTSLRGFMKAVFLAYIRLYVALERLAVRTTLSFVQGDSLYKKYRHMPGVFRTVSTTISRNDIQPFRDTCQGKGINVLFVGRLAREKGISYLLEAIAQLRHPEKAFFLNVVGDGHLRADLERKADMLGIRPRVTFHGQVPRGEALSEMYKRSDVFVLASIWEGTPKVLLEALAHGVPVVATNVGGIPTTVRNRETGILIAPESPEAIRDAILEIVEDSRLRQMLIKNGAEMAARYTLEAETGTMLETIARFCPAVAKRMAGPLRNT